MSARFGLEGACQGSRMLMRSDKPATPAPTTPTGQPARLGQIDVMRVLICASVVLTHVVFFANRMQSLRSNTLLNLLHFTRQSFFFISALVLVYAYQSDIDQHDTPRRKPGQQRRRISVLAVPYLLWTTFYALLGLT